MRFLLNLQFTSSQRVIPLNYKYELSSWIYKVFQQADPEFSNWLHSEGVNFKDRSFKLFTFSDLQPRAYEIKGDRLIVKSDEMRLVLSFMMDKAAENFIKGVFANQTFSLGDSKSRVDLQVARIESLPIPQFKEEMKFRCISPINVGLKTEADAHTQFLDPSHPAYEKRFFDNLLNKFLAHRMAIAGTALTLPQDEVVPMKLEILSSPKSRLLHIKAGKESETLVRGYIFRFKLTAPPELIELGYLGGFGEKNALGLGCVEYEQG